MLARRSPGEISSTKDRIDYYMKLAQLAERGKILCVFFADSYGGKEVYGGSQAPLLKAGTQVTQVSVLLSDCCRWAVLSPYLS